MDRRRLSSQRRLPFELWPRIRLHDGVVEGDYSDREPIDRFDTYDWYLELGPLANANREVFSRVKLPTWNDFVSHPDYDAFWKRQAFAPWLNRVTVPTLNVAGWWDQEDFYGPIKIYELLEKHDTSERKFPGRGPWNHGGWSRGTGRTLGRIDFGSDTATHYRRNVMATFLAHYLKDQGTAPTSEALTFRTGANEWTEHAAWPPVKNVTPRRLYFQEDGSYHSTRRRRRRRTRLIPIFRSAQPGAVSSPADYLGRGWSTWKWKISDSCTDVLMFVRYVTDPLTEPVVVSGRSTRTCSPPRAAPIATGSSS